MTVDPEGAAIEAAERLEQSVVGLRNDIASLRTYGVHNRRLIWTLAASLALDVILTIAVSLLAFQAVSTSDKASSASSLASRNAEAQAITCRAGNEAREAQVRLWNYVLDLSTQNNNPTPRQIEQMKQFRQYITGVFAPRDCNSPSPTVVTPSPTR